MNPGLSSCGACILPGTAGSPHLLVTGWLSPDVPLLLPMAPSSSGLASPPSTDQPPPGLQLSPSICSHCSEGRPCLLPLPRLFPLPQHSFPPLHDGVLLLLHEWPRWPLLFQEALLDSQDLVLTPGKAPLPSVSVSPSVNMRIAFGHL